MMKPERPKKKFNADPVVELFAALPRVKVSMDGPYTYQDRASDFIAVFNGQSSPEQGQRVLAQIAQICDPVARRENADKPGTLAFEAGMRRVMAEVMLCMAVKEPVKAETVSMEKTNEH